MSRSSALHTKALGLMPGGVSSNARLWHKSCPIYAPCSIFIEKAQGSHIWDVDGNEYIDYRLGFGPVILGHSDPYVHNRIHEYDEKGIIFALDNPLEVTVAEKIKSLVPGAEMLRFSVTGTEATMHAIRIARAYTGKEKILKFEGTYHGAHDYVLFSTEPPYDFPLNQPDPASLGIPKALTDLVILEQWNNFESVEKTVKKNAQELAAIICEPVMGNAAVIPPKEGFLKFLKQLCDEHSILLIFDEVKTGFRLAPGGAQQLFSVTPHLATFAKSLGNGYPISMIAGKREIMQNIGPKKVVHGGTYASNPVSLAAADATLDKIATGQVHDRIRSFGERLMKGIKQVLNDRKVEGIVQGYPGMFQFLFTEREEITNYRELRFCDFELFGNLEFELLQKGIMFDEDNGEPIFTCYSHSDQDLETTLQAIDSALPKALQKKAPSAKEKRFAVAKSA